MNPSEWARKMYEKTLDPRTSPCITCGRSEKMQKFVVTVETASASYELPVHAGSLEEALEVAEAEYEELGQVTRVRPDSH
ncbi:hypothetical protein KDKPMHDL_00100 [Klebsiella phage 066046]|uniref:Uncharacterized protein n=1 Tax=Klebsiella phage 066046 TaxID=2777401 RepID=A0A7S6R9I1_9CAUD|nr:hypothetical protein KDKPMHDL_00100 [Klebsiella phage 066046]